MGLIDQIESSQRAYNSGEENGRLLERERIRRELLEAVERLWRPMNAGRIEDIRFVTLQDARTALKEDRDRVRRELSETIDAEWEVMFTGTRYDSEMVNGVRISVLKKALDRICPEDDRDV